MESCPKAKPRLKRKFLSTRRKMKVLSALNSSKNLSEDDLKSDISSHGKEIMALLQSEQAYIEVLRDIKKVLLHPVLKGNIEALDDIIAIIDEMIVTHSNMYSALIIGRNDFEDAFKKLPSVMDSYVSYSILINLESPNFKKFSQAISDNKMEIFDLLHEPISHIMSYTTIFQNLYSAKPLDVYSEILKTAQYICEKIKNSSSLRKNAMRSLQIQRLLVKRQPRILSPGRIVLKEGILYKVNAQGTGMKKRAFFLFSDILLCCKVLVKSFTFRESDSLLFLTLFPLNSCSVSFVLGNSESKGALFKVTCGSLSYLLLSKVPGESRNWVQEIQSAIRAHQSPYTECRSKLMRRENIYMRQRVYPFMKKTRTSSEQSIKDQSLNVSDLPPKPTAFCKILKVLTCTQL